MLLENEAVQTILPIEAPQTALPLETARAISPETDFFRQVYCILGLPIDAISMEQAKDKLQAAARHGKRCFLSTPNLNFLIGSQSDASFRNSVIRSDVSVADGMPLVWIARIMGIPVHERVAGASLFECMSEDKNYPLSVYFFGGPAGAAAQAAHAVNSKSAAMKCVGFQSPGYGTVDEMSCTAMIQNINVCKPDFLVVAMGAKKGQSWIERNFYQINAPVVSHLGAVVNFCAGTISRAPQWAQRSGLEWLWRIKEEPGLWKRYFRDGLALAYLLFSKVVPCAFFQRCAAVSEESFTQAQVRLEAMGCACKLVLSGSWNEKNLHALRTALTEAIQVPSDIVLDARSMKYADSACIALFTLLYGHQTKIGHDIRFEGLNDSMRRIFKAYCVEYLSAEGKRRMDELYQSPLLPSV